MSDLEKVLDHYQIQYRPIEREQSISCPNPEHTDSHPSTSLNLGKGLFFCLACGAKGDAIDLVKLREHCTYRPAKTLLEQITGGTAEADAPVERRKPDGDGWKPRYTRAKPASARRRRD